MIKSMTGFGRSEMVDNSRRYTVEIRAVNHRYLDISLKIPKKLGVFETSVRGELKQYIFRGKVDVFVGYEEFGEKTAGLRYNKELAGEYLKNLRQMARDFGLEDDVRVSALSKYPDVLTMEERTGDEEELWQSLKRAVEEAAQRFVQSRAAEGGRLEEDLSGKLEGILKLVSFIESRCPQIVREYRSRLEDRVRELIGDAAVDEGRLLTEVAVFADRVCVDEELVRLRSHVEAMAGALREGGCIGRKLDFLAQEMNREANTVLSKTNDLEISNCGIELKTEIEKVREQIQNIE